MSSVSELLILVAMGFWLLALIFLALVIWATHPPKE